MRIRSSIVWGSLFVASVCSAASPKPDVQSLHWMQGTWRGVTNGVTMEETWSSPDGGGLVGMHKDSKGGRMVGFEYFRIASGDSDQVCYFASPGGRPAVRFCAVELTKQRVVFENRAHDFPQRVLYWLEPDGRLHARIEGTLDGELRAEDWIWRRNP